MDNKTLSLQLSLGLFFGWMLSFPFNGPILNLMLANKNYIGLSIGLIFVLFHALGLIFVGVAKGTDRSNRLMAYCALTCLVLYAVIWICPSKILPALFIPLAILASAYVLGWSQYYIKMVTDVNRIKFMSGVIISTSLVLYANDILTSYLPFGICYIINTIPLGGAFFCAKGLDRLTGCRTEAEASVSEGIFPVGLLGSFCILIFGLYINGGFMYDVMYPSFEKFQGITSYFREVPYMCILITLWFLGSKLNKMILVYLGTSLMGMAFVAFATLHQTWQAYMLIEILIQVSFGLLDIFAWTFLADIGSIFGKTKKVFGIGLSINVFAIFVGGITGRYIQHIGGDTNVKTAYFAIFSILLTFLIVPILNHYIEKHLVKKILLEIPQADMNDPIPEIQHDLSDIPNISVLTVREKEVLNSMIEGWTNKDIARKLNISENTLKTHIKHIYTKIQVSNKKELLCLVLESVKKTIS